jgi:hypothetical protein
MFEFWLYLLLAEITVRALFADFCAFNRSALCLHYLLPGSRLCLRRLLF